MITILGKEFDFSFTDADNMLKWAEAQENVKEKHKKLVNYQSEQNYDLKQYASLLRDCCAAIFDLFDGVLGEGASNTLFGSRCDFETCLDAYQEFQEAFMAQSKRLSEKADRYKPYGNKHKR